MKNSLRSLPFFTFLSAGLFSILSSGISYADDSLHADLTFKFYCPENKQVNIDNMIEKFLRSESFAVVNRALPANEKNQLSPFATYLVGIDNNDTIAQFIKHKIVTKSYSVVLMSKPPTDRKIRLEERLISFVSNDLGCDIKQLDRHTNDANSIESFNEVLKIKRSWLLSTLGKQI